MRPFDFAPLYRSTVGFDRLFQLLDSTGGVESEASTYPPYNIERKSETEYRISMAVAGFTRDEIDIQVKEQSLTIKGEKKLEKEEKDEKTGYHLMERSYGSFTRSIRLPYAVKSEAVTAQFDKGVLRVTCPKPAEALASAKKIQIQKR